MGNAYFTTTSQAVDLPTIWAPELNTALQFDIVIASLLDTRFEDTMKIGNILTLPSRRNLTAATKAAATDVTLEAAAVEVTQNYTINTWQAVGFGIDDIAEIQSKYDLRSTYTDSAAYALARALEVSCASSTVGIAKNPSGGGATQTTAVGTLGVELTDDNLISAWKQLAAAACPITDRFTVVSPGTYAGFLKIDKFVNALYNGDDAGMAVHQAKVGDLYNSEVYVSQLTNAPGAGQAQTAMFHRSHWLLIRQRMPTVHAEYRAVSIGWTIVVDQIYGVFERLEADEAAAAITNSTSWSVQLKAVA